MIADRNNEWKIRSRNNKKLTVMTASLGVKNQDIVDLIGFPELSIEDQNWIPEIFKGMELRRKDKEIALIGIAHIRNMATQNYFIS